MWFPHQKDIPEVSSLEDQAFADALASSQPIIVRGLAKSWPALTVWTRENLIERLGSLRLPMIIGKSGTFPDPDGDYTKKLPFAGYLKGLWEDTLGRPTLLDGDSALIFGSHVHPNENFAPLREDIELPAFIDPDDLRQIGFWLSRRGVSSWLHYDNNLLDNINAQIRGSKEVVLFSPSDASKLYLNTYTKDGVNRAQFSKVDLREPDAEEFPELKNALAWVGRIDAGDTVLIPSCWFHGFKHIGEVNINVNFWWKPKATPWNAITARKSLWLTALRALTSQASGEKKTSAADKLKALDPEARLLLEQMEQEVLSDRTQNRFL